VEEATGGEGLTSDAGLRSAPLPEPMPVAELEVLTWEKPKKENEETVVVRPPGEGVGVNRSASDERFRITAHRLFLLDSYYGTPAEEGERWLAVEVEVERLPHNEGRVRLRSLEDALPIRINGSLLRPMRTFRGTDPQLSTAMDLTENDPTKRNFVFYRVPKEGLGRVDLIWDREGQVPAVFPLLPADGDPPELPEPVEVKTNEVAELELYGVEMRETFQGEGRTNLEWVVVDLRGRGLWKDQEGRPGTLEWREWRPRMQLVLDGVRAEMLEGAAFDPSDRLLSGVTTGGRFAFSVKREVVAEAESIRLQCGFAPTAVPGRGVIVPETLYFTLKGDPAFAPERVEPVRRWDDLNARVELLGVSRPETVDGREADDTEKWVRVDLAVTGLAEQGVDFKPGEFLQLLATDRTEPRPHRQTWYGPQAPPNDGHRTWIPRDGRREFSMFWKVEGERLPVRLRVNGVRHFESVALFPSDGEGKGPFPESNVRIAESGIMVLNPNGEQGGIQGVGLTPAQVNTAIDKGRDFLLAKLREEVEKRGRVIPSGENYPAMLALVHCDAHLKDPEFDRLLRHFIRDARVPRNDTYENALLAMTIEAYGDPAFLPKLERIARFLVETQGEEGTWSYRAPVPGRFFPEPEEETDSEEDALLRVAGGEPVEKVALPEEPLSRTQSWTIGKNGDHSCTQFAVLGLWSAERAGIPIDEDVWARVLTRMSRHQTLGDNADRYGGYGYNGRGGAYGSMTGAGICVLAIAMDRLFDGVIPREHLRIRNALGWLVRNFTVKENPGSKKYNYYYLYSLERVGRILGMEFFGTHEWYPVGAKHLVERQSADGSWPSDKRENDLRLTTSYALLFLTRATPELNAEPEPEPTGPGTLVTTVERPDISHRVYLILDSSGSMRPEIGGKPKLDIARGAVGDLLRALPEGTRVAVRAYGHRKRAVEPGAREDTELVVPWSDLEPEKIGAELERLRPRGKTPLALSLKEAAGDISGGNAGGRTLLVLLTDGGEDDRNTDPVASAAAFAEREDVDFFILGFDINRPDWTRQLTRMAEAGGGVYRPVRDAGALTSDLRAVVYPPVPSFSVLDAEGNKAGTGVFGEGELSLPPGDYRLRATGEGPAFETAFRIRAEGTTRITLDMARLPRRAVSSEAPRSEPPGASEEDRPSFCTQCGNKLEAGAKFCTRCGNKIE